LKKVAEKFLQSRQPHSKNNPKPCGQPFYLVFVEEKGWPQGRVIQF